MAPRGALFTFEGIEGSGKTTQAIRLAEGLRALGHQVHLLREPGGTPVAEAIRSLLLDPGGVVPTPLAEAFLFQAARADVVERVVRPARASGTIVLADRYADASLAYQGAARAIGLDTIGRLNALSVGDEWPDRTYVLDVSVDQALARVRKRAETGGAARASDRSRNVGSGPAVNRMDGEPDEFHERVRSAYRDLAAAHPNRILLLDGTRPAGDLAEEILRDARDVLARAGR